MLHLLRRSQTNRRRSPIHLHLRPRLPRALVSINTPIYLLLFKQIILKLRLFLEPNSLQQWFEYCSNSTKKYNCPVCKQNCVGYNATRLYFQSVGDQSDSLCSQKLIDREEDADALRGEVKRLLVKLSGLSSALEHQQKEHNEINEEVIFGSIFILFLRKKTVVI